MMAADGSMMATNAFTTTGGGGGAYVGWRDSKFFFLIVLSFAILTDSLLYGAIVPLLPVYRELYGFSTFGIGALFVCFGVFQLLATVPSGFACDRFGPRRVLAWGLLLLFVTTVLFAAARSVVFIVVARCAQGAVAALTWTASLAAVPQALPTTEQGSASTLLNSVAGLGVLLGPVVGGALYEVWGVGGPYYVLAGLVCVDGLLRVLLGNGMFERRSAARLDGGSSAGDDPQILLAEDEDTILDVERARDNHLSVVELDGDTQTSLRPPPLLPDSKRELILGMLRDRSILVLLLGALLASGAFATFETLTPLHLADTFKLSPMYIGFLYATVPLAFTLVSPVAGWLSDRYPQLRRHQLVLGLCWMGVCMSLVVLPSVLWIQVLILVMTGFASAFTVSTSMPELNRICEVRFGSGAFGTMSGVQNAVWSLGATLLPLLASGTASTKLGAEVSMSLCGGIMIIAGLVVLFVGIVGNSDPQTLYSGYKAVESADIADMDITLVLPEEDE